MREFSEEVNKLREQRSSDLSAVKQELDALHTREVGMLQAAIERESGQRQLVRIHFTKFSTFLQSFQSRIFARKTLLFARVLILFGAIQGTHREMH